MKIFISCALFYPSKLGGPANTLYWLAKGLVSKGHEVFVVTTYENIEDESIYVNQQTVIDGINVIYCSSRINLLKYSFSIISKCDIILLSSLCYSPELLIALKAKALKKKVIWSPRGELTKSAIGGRISKLMFFKLISQLVGKYVIFHATSKDEERCIKNIMGDRVKTILIPNYMEIPSLCQRSNNNSFNPYFLFCGRIAPIKAIENLIEGLALSKKFLLSNYELKIAGSIEPQFENYYNNLVHIVEIKNLQKKVKFIGPISGYKKFQTYCDAHFLFLISKSENFGNVVIEALSQGTPVVASHGTPWEPLIQNGSGFWIDNSPESISRTVDEILSLDDLTYDDFRKNALSYVDSFNVYKNINIWIKEF